MFNNLIESNSHVKEFKRRVSFLLFTFGTYAVLFVVTGVVSIYAYDAHLEEQNSEISILTFPHEIKPDEPEIVRNTIPRSPTTPSNNTGRSTRTVLMDSPTNPNNPPKEVGTVAPNVPPARSDSTWGPTNSDPAPIGSGKPASGSGGGSGVVVEIPDNPPPPIPQPTPVVPKILKVSEVLNGQAQLLPKPPYPQMAKITRTQGRVTVQVLIDETGKVVSAKAVDGPPLLIADSQRAAYGAKFSPTRINGQPVKVSGVIIYNFVLP